jgi:hypothetical protein
MLIKAGMHQKVTAIEVTKNQHLMQASGKKTAP